MENRDKKWLWAAFVLILAGAVLIAVTSVIYQAQGGMMMSDGFSFGGFMEQTALKNEKKFEAEGIHSIEIEYSSPDVIFYAGDTDKIEIKEYLRNRTENAEIKVEGDTLVCRGGKSNWSFLGGRPEKIEVYLPSDYAGQLQLSTTSGNIDSEEAWSMEEFEADSTSGNITVGAVTASKIEISTTSGNIRFEKAAGELKVKATSGNIDMGGIAGKCVASASSGNIDLEADELNGDMEVQTSSGNMNLILPENSSFTYKGSASSGDIHTSFDESLHFNEKGNRAEGTYGADAVIRISTSASSGNTRVKFR